MTAYIVLSGAEILTLCADKPVTIYVDKKPYVLCSDECFEKQRYEPQESEVQDADSHIILESQVDNAPTIIEADKEVEE